MTLILSPVPERYDAYREQQRNDDLERADRDNVKRWDMPAGILDPGYLRSPDGTRWKLVVDDAGVVTAEPV